MGELSRMSVRHHHVAAFEFVGTSLDTRDVVFWLAADLQLEFRVSLRLVGCKVLSHFIRWQLSDGAIERDRLALAPTHEIADRHAASLAKQIPAGHVDSRFDIGVTEQGPVHHIVDNTERGRIKTDEMRGEFSDAGASSGCEGGQVERSERADFTDSSSPVYTEMMLP